MFCKETPRRAMNRKKCHSSYNSTSLTHAQEHDCLPGALPCLTCPSPCLALLLALGAELVLVLVLVLPLVVLASRRMREAENSAYLRVRECGCTSPSPHSARGLAERTLPSCRSNTSLKRGHRSMLI